MTSKEQQFISGDEAEQRFGLPHNFLRVARRSDNGPRFFRLGARTIVYRPGDVQAWLDNCAVDKLTEASR